MPWPENIVPNTYPTGTEIGVAQIIDNASNVRIGENPPYTVADFLSVYPGFSPAVPEPILQIFVDLAHASVKQVRYQDAWQFCMGLFVAHFATLWLQGTTEAGSPAAKVIAAGETRGLRISKSVGDVSVNYDYNVIAQDLNGWAAWKLTTYGVQFATIAKILGKGNMMVW